MNVFLYALYHVGVGDLGEVPAQLKISDVVHMDETFDRVGTSSGWFHVASTDRS